MKTVHVNGHEVKFFESSQQLPIKRLQRFNKFIMIDNEVGSDLQDYNRRTIQAQEFLRKQMYKEAIVELENRRQAVFNCLNEYSPKNLSLAILVYSINGKVYEDYSDSGLEEVIKDLDYIGFTEDMLLETRAEVKKKWRRSLQRTIHAISKLRKKRSTIPV